MDWSASVTRLETSIYLNFSALEELLHTYDDLFGSKQSLIIDKTLGCLCNAITDILKKSSGTGREKIHRISSLKKIRSKLSDVKRWETDVMISCCQLALIDCRKVTSKLSQAFWKWKSVLHEERNQDIISINSDLSHSQGGYSNIHQSRISHAGNSLPPLPMTERSSHSPNSSLESNNDSQNYCQNFLGTPTELSDDQSPDLSVDVSEDSVDQNINIGPLNSVARTPSDNSSSYLATYLTSPHHSPSRASREDEKSSVAQATSITTSRQSDEDEEEDCDVSLERLSLENILSNRNPVVSSSATSSIHDTSVLLSSTVAVTSSNRALLHARSHSYESNVPMAPLTHSIPQSPSDDGDHDNSVLISNPSNSAIEIHWNEFSSSDEKSSTSHNSELEGMRMNETNLDITELSGPSEEEDIDDDDDDDDENNHNQDQEQENQDDSKSESSAPKDLTEYSLSDVMNYLSLPVERTPRKSLQSSVSSNSSPSPPPATLHQSVTPGTSTSSTTVLRGVGVSSINVSTPKQLIPPPPSRRGSASLAPPSPSEDKPKPSRNSS